jgi:uncharacterized protein YukE
VSLDLTYEALVRFAARLEACNHALRASQSALAASRAEVDPLWQDQSRRAYDAAMDALQQRLDTYVGSESDRYEAFMREKRLHLETFLRGE